MNICYLNNKIVDEYTRRQASLDADLINVNDCSLILATQHDCKLGIYILTSYLDKVKIEPYFMKKMLSRVTLKYDFDPEKNTGREIFMSLIPPQIKEYVPNKPIHWGELEEILLRHYHIFGPKLTRIFTDNIMNLGYQTNNYSNTTLTIKDCKIDYDDKQDLVNFHNAENTIQETYTDVLLRGKKVDMNLFVMKICKQVTDKVKDNIKKYLDNDDNNNYYKFAKAKSKAKLDVIVQMKHIGLINSSEGLMKKNVNERFSSHFTVKQGLEENCFIKEGYQSGVKSMPLFIA